MASKGSRLSQESLKTGELTPRQRELAAVGARLFARRGFHAVGINEISGELGLTGPAFYRHFPSKEALLVALLDEAISRHLEEVHELAAVATDERALIEAMVLHHIAFAFDNSDSIQTWRTEYRSLPELDAQRIRHLQRLYIDEWVRVLVRLREDLDPVSARSVCYATIALMQSGMWYSSKLTEERTAELLSQLAMELLLTP